MDDDKDYQKSEFAKRVEELRAIINKIETII